MAWEYVNKILLENIAKPYTSLSGIMDACVECGWTLHDSDYENTNPYAVLKSHPDATDDGQSPCYVGFKVFSNSTYWLRMYFFLHWDEVAHTYNGTLSTYSFSNSDIIAYHHEFNHFMYFSSDNNLTIYGNKYFLNFRNFRWDNRYVEGLNIFKLQDLPYDYSFKLLNTVDSGMDKVLQLEDTTISGIEVGDNTFVLCKDNHSFSKIIVKEKSTVSGTITAEEIKYPTVSGSYIGSPTTLYPWVFWNESSHTNTNYYSRDHSFFAYNYDRVNGKYTSSATTHYDGTTTGNYWYPASGWTDNLVSVGYRNVIEHPLFYNSSSVVEILGKSDYMATGNGAEGDITGYNKLVVGQATSGTTNTLTEINKSWVIDQFAGKSLVISDSTKLEEVKHIISNTSDTITVYDDFTTIPNSNTMFGIFDAVYVRCYHTGHDYSYSIRIA